MKVLCGNCDWSGLTGDLARQLENCVGLGERLTPGDVVPVGDCPCCFALAYLVPDLPAPKPVPLSFEVFNLAPDTDTIELSCAGGKATISRDADGVVHVCVVDSDDDSTLELILGREGFTTNP